MTIRVALHHRTTYRFDRPVKLSPHVIRLRPAPHCRTHIDAYSLNISGDDHFLNWQQDPFGNFNARVVFPEPRKELTIAVELVAP
ncbi:MAG: transglutaminase N-terminal domain-containing protein, partial [Pseudomonadota bacterium]|nr:transglutaminase N-terminal domain-containing protein [Pseudomonadota bacterium]